MSEPKTRPVAIHQRSKSMAGLISFLLAIVALLLLSWSSMILVTYVSRDARVPAGATVVFPLYFFAALFSGLGIGFALNAEDQRPQLMPSLLGLALNGPILVFACGILLTLAFVASGLCP